MTKGRKQTFGSLVRQERGRLKIGLRDMARRIGVSPTYLSMVERDKFPPPAEDKVVAIAQIIGVDRDELLALAGRVSSEVQAKIIEDPSIASLIRHVLEKEELKRKLREDWKKQEAKLRDEFGDRVVDNVLRTQCTRAPTRRSKRSSVRSTQGRGASRDV